MKGYNNVRAGFETQTLLSVKLILVFLLIISSLRNAHSQMEVLIVLNSSRGGIVTIEKYNLEQPQKIIESSFLCDSIRIILNYTDSILLQNEVFRYTINFTDGSFSQSQFMGSPERLVIDMSSTLPRYRLTETHPLYSLFDISDNYDGSEDAKAEIIAELEELLKSKIALNYVSYIVYHAYSVNMLTRSEALKLLSHVNSQTSNYWIERLKEKLESDSNSKNDFTSDFDFLFNGGADYVLLKFWAKWCKPCIQDNQVLHSQKAFLRKKKVKVIPLNTEEATVVIKDRNSSYMFDIKSLLRQYNVSSLPRYILIKRDSIDQMDVQDLNKILNSLKVSIR